MSRGDELRIMNGNLRAPSAYRLVLIGLLLLAFALRLYRLDAQSLWYDEGVSAVVSQYDLPALTAWTADDIQPPLYYYLLAGWGRLAGWGEWSVRFLSVFWGVLTVPLLAVLAAALSQSRFAALVGAAITTTHPLFVYYSQEARMYTLLVALAVLIGFALYNTQLADQRQRQRESVRWWTVYVFAATAAIYTHYFAFFLLLALAMNGLLFSIGDTSARLRFFLWRFVPANFLLLLLYIPWFFALFRRLAVDTSYWQGEFKWWEGLRHVGITFVMGESVLETDGIRWLAFFAVITFLIVSGGSWRSRWKRLAYALIWIIVPVLCVLTLAWINPKFNARYTMIALPGLILLWSNGISQWIDSRERAGDTALRRFAPFVATVFSLLLLYPFALSLHNWFTDPAFTKAQWRELATFVKLNIQPDERVLLTSGHAWPIWQYYAPELLAIRLPEIEILDVNAVLDYQSAAQTLQAQFGDATGVWLVKWQDEVVDPNGMAERVLSSIGEAQPVNAEFWQLRLQHFTKVQAQRITLSPDITVSTNYDFGGVLKLLGYSQSENGDLLLAWQRGERAIPEDHDLLLTGLVATFENIPYGKLSERRPAAYEYPVARWKPGEIVIGHIPLADLVVQGELPGSFQLALTLFDPQGDPAGFDVISKDGQHIGKQAAIHFVVGQPMPGSDDLAAQTWQEVQPGLHVMGKLSATESEFGTALWADLYWYATQSQPPIPFQISVGEATEAKQMMQQQDSTAPLSAESVLPANQVLHQRIRLPRGVVGKQPVQLVAGVTNASAPLLIGEVVIRQGERNFEIPPLSLSLNGGYYSRQPNGQIADAPTVQLLGLLDAVPLTLSAGSQLSVALVWQASRPSTTTTPDYSLSLQFLDLAGDLQGQIDSKIANGTATWLDGQVETQTIKLTAPTKAGDYQLVLVVYDPTISGLPRLLTATGDEYLEIATVQVTE